MIESTLVRADTPENYLLVEGKEDEDVFERLLAQYQVFEHLKSKRESLIVKGQGGIGNLLKERVLRNYLVGDESKRYGIILDADEDLKIRWQQVKSILEHARIGYRGVPKTPLPDGTILQQEGLATVGIWLMPDNQIPGIMESFIGWLVPKDDLLWPMAGDVVQKVIERDRRFNKRYVDASASHAQNFIGWIRRLFDVPSVE